MNITLDVVDIVVARLGLLGNILILNKTILHCYLTSVVLPTQLEALCYFSGQVNFVFSFLYILWDGTGHSIATRLTIQRFLGAWYYWIRK